MHLRIVHTTGYEYDDHIAASFNEARLTPQTQAGQLVTHSRVEVSPAPWTYSYRDYWGSHVTAFEVLEPHESLTVVSTCTVHTNQFPRKPAELTWEELAAGADERSEFLAVSERVRPPEELAERCQAIARASSSPTDAARSICALVRDEVRYISGSTGVQTLAASAWEQRSGVCQDLAHLVIGGLRSVGIPARYVSGYLHPTSEPEVGTTTAGESHAWIEWWDGDWQGFDPTNDQPPGERHVTVATGRDYDDVRPLAGIYAGPGGTSRMFVDVQITRLP